MVKTNEVAGAGKGFFTESGELKAKDQIQKESAAQAAKGSEAEAPSEGAAVGADFESQVKNVFGALKSGFVDKANKVLKVVNENESNLEQADKVVREQLDNARELRQAIKDNDTKLANEKRKELIKLEKRRAKVSEEIESDNDKAVTDRVKNLNLGNEQKGIVKVDPVKLEKSKAADLDSEKGVTEYINKLKDDKASIREQKAKIYETKNNVLSKVKEAKAEIEKIAGAAIDSYESAQSNADKLAEAIRGGAQGALNQKIDANVAGRLLS